MFITLGYRGHAAARLVLLVAFWSAAGLLTAWAMLPAIGGALVLAVCILSTPTGAGVALLAAWIAFRSIG